MTATTAEAVSAHSVTRNSLEVWGDPIAHSLSPRLHAAAYRELGLPWSYGRRRVDEASFPAELASLGAEFRGLSLTYPLKGVAYDAAVTRDRFATLTGAVNTLVMSIDGPHGYNTDVAGLVADLREHGASTVERARIVGAGATATSALVALADLGAREVEVVARRAAAVEPLAALGARIGVTVTGRDFGTAPADAVSVTLSTLPGGATLPDGAGESLAAGGGVLYDVVYGTWPTPLALAWEAAGCRAVNGLGMLLHQAVRQVRIFTAGDADLPLPGEEAVVAVMRSALMGD